jgi:L-methionine (R)-S-oxide reductase
MVVVVDYSSAEQTIQKLLATRPKATVLQQVVDVLYDEFENYSWVGIYLVKGDLLVLGPWRGKQATEHTTIPFGKGVCGAAASTGKTELVKDVTKDKRYLSCFLSTRSEIVVPIKKNTVVVGEIDIDSDRPGAFDTKDVVFLEKVARCLSEYIE